MKWYKVWTHDMTEPVLIIKAGSLAEAIAAAKKESPSYVDGQEYKQANKCRYYRRQQFKERRESLTGRSYYVEITAGVCYRDPAQPCRCRCNGDETECDF